ncbi:MAG: hypothetical protein WED09_05220 [Homoserinimonas sp.]
MATAITDAPVDPPTDVIARIVAAAPPLSEATRAKIAALLKGGQR